MIGGVDTANHLQEQPPRECVWRNFFFPRTINDVKTITRELDSPPQNRIILDFSFVSSVKHIRNRFLVSS